MPVAMVSLLTGAFLVFSTQSLSVLRRRSGLALLRALGVTGGSIQRIFLLEAALLTSLGGILGIGAGLALAALLRLLIPGMPVHTPLPYLVAALSMSIVTGLLSGIAPARRAAALEPVDALRTE